MRLWDAFFGVKSAAFGRLGRSVAAASKSEFFTWFHLEPAEDTGRADVVRFRPSSDQLAPCVSLDLTLANGRIVTANLAVRRDFIDDPRQFAFAADITRSFLMAALDPTSDIDAATQAIMDYRPADAATVVIRNTGPSPVFGLQTDAGGVYAGNRTETNLTSGALQARLHNAGPVLHIDVSAA